MRSLPESVVLLFEELRSEGLTHDCTWFRTEFDEFWNRLLEVYRATAPYRATPAAREKGLRSFMDFGFVEFGRKVCIVLRQSEFLPRENPAPKKKRRKDIATTLQKLRKEIESDPDLSAFSLLDFIRLAERDKRPGLADILKGSGPDPMADTFVRRYAAGSVRLADVLFSLQGVLERFEPIHDRDVTSWSSDIPHVNRAERSRIFVEKRLPEVFREYTGSTQDDLIVCLVNTMFGRIDSELEIRNRRSGRR